MKDLPAHVTRALRDAAAVGYLAEIDHASRAAIVATFQRKPAPRLDDLEALIVLGIGEDAAREQIAAVDEDENAPG